ncbi:MAG: hypothetical protein JWQ49_1049 [Edaphobacter sp.]|nr:hypothetical protein [Edaphobacter sp.]
MKFKKLFSSLFSLLGDGPKPDSHQRVLPRSPVLTAVFLEQKVTLPKPYLEASLPEGFAEQGTYWSPRLQPYGHPRLDSIQATSRKGQLSRKLTGSHKSSEKRTQL